MNKTILAIDPGPEQSAWMLYDTKPLDFGIVDNDRLLSLFSAWQSKGRQDDAGLPLLAVEMVACYGMPVGKSVFDTCVWIGRFVQAWSGKSRYVYRKDVKLHLCNSLRAKDPNVRQALIDKFGGKDVAIGGTKCRRCKGKGWYGAGRPVCPECRGDKWKHPPGPLFGIAEDVWSALAIAVYQSDGKD